jgi:hypothetical protein
MWDACRIPGADDRIVAFIAPQMAGMLGVVAVAPWLWPGSAILSESFSNE